MNDVYAILRLAARRIGINRFMGALHVTAVLAAGLALVLMIVDRLGAMPIIPWVWTAIGLGVTALLASIVRWMVDRPDEQHVALLVDERLDLRERITTAMHCANRDDGFSQAAVQDAVATCSDPKIRRRVNDRFRIETPRAWWVSPLLLAMVLGAYALPQFDAFRSEDDTTQLVESEKQVIAVEFDRIKQVVEENPVLQSELADLLNDTDPIGLDDAEQLKPEDMRREAIKRMSDINKRLEELSQSEEAKAHEAVRDALRDLESPESGPAKELADALKQGDFDAAQKALDAMMEQMQSGEMTDAERQALGEQLQQMGEQLQQLSEKREALEDALRQAGLDPQLAQNPEALQQALENNQNLNEQQQQQLQQMAQAQQRAAQMCQKMGGACQQMGQGLCQGQSMGQQGPGQNGEGSQGMNADAMQAALAELAEQERLNQACQLAAGACQGGAEGLGENLSASDGMRHTRGRAAGARPGKTRTPHRTQAEQAQSKHGDEAEVIARQLINGELFTGESRAPLEQVAANLERSSDEATMEQILPRKYHDAVKHYFGQVKREVVDRQPAGEPSGNANSSDE